MLHRGHITKVEARRKNRALYWCIELGYSKSVNCKLISDLPCYAECSLSSSCSMDAVAFTTLVFPPLLPPIPRRPFITTCRILLLFFLSSNQILDLLVTNQYQSARVIIIESFLPILYLV
jgi:hypothetical protein